MHCSRALRTALTLAAAFLIAPAAHAAAPAAAVAPDTVPTEFSIPAQPLVEALAAFAEQAGVVVHVAPKALEGLVSRPVVGKYEAEQALRMLLSGTELVVTFDDPRSATLTLARDNRMYTLPTLTVVGASSKGYARTRTTSAMKTDTPLRDTPQTVSIVMRDVIADQAMQSMADVVHYVPGVSMGQGEGHRDAPTIRGNSSTADFFVDGVRDDAQYYRDLYNVDRVEALKGANAMIFGRGGGGGVINRVTKDAQWTTTRSATLETGSFAHRRGTLDFGGALSSTLAARFNGMYENSAGFRDRAELTRFGLNPTIGLALGRTTVRAGLEYFSDDRNVDRGIPSYHGAPAPAELTTFFGNPDSSYATARVTLGSLLIEQPFGGSSLLRNRTHFTHYDKFYQNSLPGAVNAAGTQVNLSAYSNSTDRSNIFNQTDLIAHSRTGGIGHTLLLGAELGRQSTDNFRNTGYYNNTATSFAVAFAQPTVTTPITFRQSATDADSHTDATVAAAYVQDQVALTSKLQAIGGVRFDRFNIAFHNNRNGEKLERADHLISPRFGLVLKPLTQASFYGSYSVSYLPSSGDQFGSLTATTETLEPEQFTNYEAGLKWDLRPTFALTTSVYQLDRTNTTAPDPLNPGQVLQTGGQRSRGLEIGAMGDVTDRWQLVAGAAFQKAEIVSQTNNADPGDRVPLVPARTLSLWNRYQALEHVGVGVGLLHQSGMFAAIDNTVRLPAFTRLDAAVFVRLTSFATAQVNVENVLNDRYFPTSHGNNNIMPGAPRTLRLSVSTRR